MPESMLLVHCCLWFLAWGMRGEALGNQLSGGVRKGLTGHVST